MSILSGDVNSEIKYVDAVIANGESLSAAVDLKAHRLHHMIFPEDMDGGEILAQVSPDGVAAYVDLYSATATYKLAPSAVAGESRCVIVPLVDMFAFRFMKLKTTTPVGAERTVKLGLVPR